MKIKWTGKGVDEIGLVKDVSGRSEKLEKWIGKPIVRLIKGILDLLK